MKVAAAVQSTVPNQQGWGYGWLTSRLPAARPLRLLDIGCGDCLEGAALLDAGVTLVGIDQDESAIAAARIRLPGARLLSGDAAATNARWQSPFDVVLVRRPDIAAQPARWRQILTLAPDWLAADGTILVTTPGPQEARLAEGWLAEAGLTHISVDPLAKEDERFLITARHARAKQAAPGAVRPANVVEWEADDGEQALVCDLTTGLCSPAV